ncbi:hypothetical protein M404DRAFT_336946 [Pisolithus tinctorius Marx 270]|uniref:Uncharacterized protein n=1 Tax=Pisolithus tinctorius Marx 270 TaxID=870435 RepID=A0A0C3NHM3_PISTI|nr:hypothetical protein M404DRAFT_336946 [Pisolithus tinctorius Marx 270]
MSLTSGFFLSIQLRTRPSHSHPRYLAAFLGPCSKGSIVFIHKYSPPNRIPSSSSFSIHQPLQNYVPSASVFVLSPHPRGGIRRVCLFSSLRPARQRLFPPR